ALAALCGSVQAQQQIIDDNGRVAAMEAENVNVGYAARIITSTSPDGPWIFCFRNFGSHWESNYLYRSRDGLKFEPAFKGRDNGVWKNFHEVEGVSFDDQAWKFFYKAE